MTVKADIHNRMKWRLKRKRLGDVKTGDLLIDEDGRATRVRAVTEETGDEDVFTLTLVSNLGVRSSYHATADHVWPLDPSMVGAVPSKAAGETEATTLDIAEWTAAGYHPVLSPILSGGGEEEQHRIRWTVASCVMMSPEDAKRIRTKCVKVNSPTHTFMLAPNTERKTKTGKGGTTRMEVVSGGNVTVCADDLKEVMTTAAPTHNCGGPLALDTEIPLFSGGVTTMGEVKVGETLIGRDGRPVNVTEISPVMKPEDLYELEFESV